MNLHTLAQRIEDAADAGLEMILVEEQSRGSAAAYEIADVVEAEIEDEDADPELVDCPDCGGEGVLTDEDDNEEECPECDGSGSVDGDKQPKKTVLMLVLDHAGYAPAGTREALS
jgi:hypothetical protein